MRISIGIVDDHQLFLKALCLMINSFNGCEVVLEALSGKALQEKIVVMEQPPDIMLIDVNMPVMNGIATAKWLSEKYPAVNLVALSMSGSNKTIISMINAGCCAYLLKDLHPEEFERALIEIFRKGYYSSDACQINYRRLILLENDLLSLSEKELQFLQLACSERSYHEIATAMFLSERTIETYREKLFSKFCVHNRVGLALEAIRRGLVDL